MRLPIAALASFVLVAGAANPARAVDFGDGNPPSASYETTSFLTPTHLGNYVIGDGNGSGFGSNPAKDCWDAFEEKLYKDHPDDWEPDDLAIEVAMTLLPEACKTNRAVQLTEPEVLTDNCPAGSIFAIKGTRRWFPGSPFDPPGRFYFSGVTGSDVVNEVAFNTCFEIFDADTDIVDVANAVPTPGFGKSPEVVGLTGLDTWLWYDFTDPTSHYLELDTTVDTIRNLPITIQARAWVDEIHWDMDGDGSWDTSVDIPEPLWYEPPPHSVYISAGGSNSEDEAAAHYLYETKGTYTVSVATVWHGVYAVTVPGFGGIYQYPPVARVETFDYLVCELQGVLTQPGEQPDLNTCPVP